jgi:nucleotide-binding universal stress UspA family protein
MFKNILVPTDGSKLAMKGAKAGVKLASALGARVTALYVIAPLAPVLSAEGTAYFPSAAPTAYQKAAERSAKRALAAVEIEADTASVPCTSVFVTDPQPWGAMLRVARSKKCDAIALASHGRGALGGLILGSETQRVLAHSKIPVLVTR